MQDIQNKNAKKFIIITLLYPIPFVILIFGLIYIYDPLQIFHKPYFREATFFTDIRKQALGIIKHYDFNSYIIGTSMLENTDPKEVQEKLADKGKWMNISLSGSAFSERAIVMDYIFNNQNPKHIIYSLDGYMVIAKNKNSLDWDFLYNNLIDDIRIYLNRKFITCATIFSNKKKCIGATNNIYQIIN